MIIGKSLGLKLLLRSLVPDDEACAALVISLPAAASKPQWDNIALEASRQSGVEAKRLSCKNSIKPTRLRMLNPYEDGTCEYKRSRKSPSE
jgi:hypothetical protein